MGCLYKCFILFLVSVHITPERVMPAQSRKLFFFSPSELPISTPTKFFALVTFLILEIDGTHQNLKKNLKNVYKLVMLFRLQTVMTEPLNICPYLCRLLHIDRTDNFRCTSLKVQKKIL